MVTYKKYYPDVDVFYMQNLEKEMSLKIRSQFQLSLEEFEVVYMPFLDLLPDATILTELAMPSKIILANSLATQLFLYSQQEIATLTVMDLFSDSSKELFVKNRDLYEQDPQVLSLGFKDVQHDYYGKKANGEEFPLDRSLSPVSINGKIYILAGFRDLTKLKLSVSQLAAQEAEIDIERSIFQQQQDFMDTLCHELLNPLNGAYNSVELLTSSFKSYKDLLLRLSPYEQEKFFNDIETKLAMATDCIEQQKVTVRDMLTITHLNNKKIILNLNNFELIDAIKELCNGFLDKMQGKNLKLILDLPTTDIWLKGDKQKILQILANIISNSIHSNCYGDISLNVSYDLTSCHNNTNVVINFVLQDTGTDLLSKEEIDNIFLPFGRKQVVTGMEYDQSKLALSISKKLIELMDGDIKVENQKSVGTKFSFYIKCFALSKEEIIEAINANSLKDKLINGNTDLNLSGKKILIVEDNRINMVLLNKILEPTHCICYYAYDGEEAIEQFKRNRFDLIFMDIGLPKLDGIEVSKWIRQQELLAGYRTPIVCLSAFNLAISALPKEQIIDEYIPKPYDKKSIFEVIAKHILLKPGSDSSLSEKRQQLIFAPIPTSSSYQALASSTHRVTAVKSTASLNKVTDIPPHLYLENRASVNFNRPINLLNYYNNNEHACSRTSINTPDFPAPLQRTDYLLSSTYTQQNLNTTSGIMVDPGLLEQRPITRIKKTKTCLIL